MSREPMTPDEAANYLDRLWEANRLLAPPMTRMHLQVSPETPNIHGFVEFTLRRSDFGCGFAFTWEEILYARYPEDLLADRMKHAIFAVNRHAAKSPGVN